jgi:hypothetical protein
MNHGNPQDGHDPSAQEMRMWVVAASRWGQASQTVVGAAANLALASRTLADAIDTSHVDRSPTGRRRQALAGDLRGLSDEVEADTEELRDRFLATEANLAEYRQIIG